MTENKLANLHNIHFIGIGGAGMSAIAYVLLKRGYDVTGSDLNAGHMSAHLAEEGAMVFMGHDACQVDGADVLLFLLLFMRIILSWQLLELKVFRCCIAVMCWQQF